MALQRRRLRIGVVSWIDPEIPAASVQLLAAAKNIEAITARHREQP
jgi:hypothetical protein